MDDGIIDFDKILKLKKKKTSSSLLLGGKGSASYLKADYVFLQEISTEPDFSYVY